MHMRSRIMAIVAGFIMVGSSTTVWGQQQPDFSGSWQAVKDTPSTVAAAPTPVFGERFAMKQTGQTLSLVRPVRGRTQPFVTTHTLDGAENRILLPSRTCLGQSGQIVTTAWEGNTLAYTIAGNLAPGSTTPTKVGIKYAFKLETPDTLVIQTTMRTAATAEPTAVATVYKKTAEPIPAADTTAKQSTAAATIAQVEWIAGTWIGTLGTASIEERWIAPSGGSMLATSRTIRGNAMMEFEFLCISEREGSLVYTAMPNAAPPTDFMLTNITADSATFENPTHDFPKMIRYAKRPDGTLEATISGAANQRPTTFVFKKQN